MSLLSLRNLSVADASGRVVVRDLSIDVHPGETMCLVGESGSGKSVTSLAVMGLLPRGTLRPVGGEILLAEESLLAAGETRLRALRATSMAMIFQEPMTALNPIERVGNQIDEVLRAHTSLGARERRSRILSMLEEVHLPDVERICRSFPHEMSGGQRQRIMIAMALILRPRLLIADEPTTALDVTTQKQIIGLIKELRENHGTAVLFITHDMGVVREIADRVTVMRNGAIVESGSAQDVLATPREEYTRRLLAAVPSLVPRQRRPETGSKVLLQVRGLGKRYGLRSMWGKPRQVVAARDVDFSLRAGRTLGIVGESGSGKSTVARCAIRLTNASEGTIDLDGQSVTGGSPRDLRLLRRRVQMVFQDPYRSLNPRMRVGDSIIEGPTNYGVPRSEAMIEARRLLELVGLPADAVKRYPHQFSGGQRQRIAIARALAMKPEVLVADEAVSALDVSVQSQVLELLRDVQERFGLGILFITHDLRVAAQICDEIIVMKSGSIVEQGPADAVLGKPQAQYTRLLFEAAPGRQWDFANCRPIQPTALAVAAE
nr:ABC transporter ATP-binding protein [Bradyrhizobium sp. CCBAU 53338]